MSQSEVLFLVNVTVTQTHNLSSHCDSLIFDDSLALAAQNPTSLLGCNLHFQKFEKVCAVPHRN